MPESADRRLPKGDVTLLFTDIEGSTRLLHEIGDVYGEVLGDHDRVLRGVWETHGGVVVDAEGDAIFVAFSDPSGGVDGSTRRCVSARRWTSSTPCRKPRRRSR